MGLGKLRSIQSHAAVATCRPSGSGRDTVGVGQKWPNGHLFLCSILVPSQCPLLLLVFVFSLLLGKYLYCIVMSIFVYYLLMYFVFLNLQKNSKKKKSRLQVQSIILFRILVRNE